MPGMDNRAACAVVLRRKSPRCVLTPRDSDARRALEEIVRALSFVQQYWTHAPEPTLRQMGPSATARPCLDGKPHPARVGPW